NSGGWAPNWVPEPSRSLSASPNLRGPCDCAAALEASEMGPSATKSPPERGAGKAEPRAAPPAPPLPDAGASIAQSGALLLLVAAIIAAVAALALPTTVSDNVSYALCKIFNAGNASNCESPADRKFKPDACTVALSQQTYGAAVDIAFFQV